MATYRTKGPDGSIVYIEADSPEEARRLKAAGQTSSAPSPADVAASAPAPIANPKASRSNAIFTGAIQGLTMNFSDEIGGAVRAAIPGGEGFSDYVARQNKEQEELFNEYPIEYGGAEIGGAVAGSFVPGVGWASGPARAAKAATTTARVASALARGTTTGATQAALSAAGKSQGSLGERAWEGIQAAPVGAVGGIVGEGIGAGISKIAQKYGATASRTVERNLRSIAEAEGLTPDEVFARVAAGEVFAGMNETTRMAARAIKNKSPGAGAKLVDQNTARLGQRQGEVFQGVESELAPGLAGSPNLHEAATEALTTNRETAGAAFGAIRNAAATQDPAALEAAVNAAVAREPAIAGQLNAFYRRSGIPELFDETGQMVRPVQVADAEYLTGALGEVAQGLASPMNPSASRMGAHALGEAQGGLRSVVDRQAPQLAGPRQRVADAIEAQETGYPLGRKGGLAQAPDEFAYAYEGLSAPGQEAARLGTAASLRARRASRGSNASLIDELADPGRAAGANIRTQIGEAPFVQPGGVGDSIKAAQSEQMLQRALQGNSTTIAQHEAGKRLQTGGGGNIFDAIDSVTGDGGIMRNATKAMRMVLGGAEELDDAQLNALADHFNQTDPDLIRKALGGDEGAAGQIRYFVNNQLAKIGRKQGSVIGTQAATKGGPSILDMFSTGGQF